MSLTATRREVPVRDPLFDPSVVAEMLGVTPKTLAQWRWLGKGPAFTKVGGRIRYRASAVDAYLQAQTVGRPTTPAEYVAYLQRVRVEAQPPDVEPLVSRPAQRDGDRGDAPMVSEAALTRDDVQNG